MTAEEKENKKRISAAEYIRTTFQSSDRLAVLVRNRSRGETIQRITTSARIVSRLFRNGCTSRMKKNHAISTLG